MERVLAIWAKSEEEATAAAAEVEPEKDAVAAVTPLAVSERRDVEQRLYQNPSLFHLEDGIRLIHTQKSLFFRPRCFYWHQSYFR